MNQHKFDYWMPTRIHCANKAAYHMEEFIAGGSVLMVVSKTLYNNGTAAAIAKAFQEKKITYYFDIESDPSTTCVDLVVDKAREVKATTIIGIGGGSVLDVCKAVACLTTTDDHILAYLEDGEKILPQRKTKLILVPTTAGTGSEVTNIAVFMNLSLGKKIPMVNDQFYADDAVIDASLSHTMPAKVTANTGMDAFCHALESYWNAHSNPISDVLAMEAMKLIFANIKKAYDQPLDEVARENMMLSALLAGLAFSQTRTTAAHALSYPISAMQPVTHGEACAISLPALIRLSHELAEAKMIRLERELGYGDEKEFAQAVEELLQSLHMPNRLSQIGINEKDVERIVQTAMTYKKQLDLTPTTITLESLRTLISELL